MNGEKTMNSENESRDCNNCIFHAGGKCRKWTCNFISVDEAEEAVDRLRIVASVLKRK